MSFFTCSTLLAALIVSKWRFSTNYWTSSLHSSASYSSLDISSSCHFINFKLANLFFLIEGNSFRILGWSSTTMECSSLYIVWWIGFTETFRFHLLSSLISTWVLNTFLELPECFSWLLIPFTFRNFYLKRVKPGSSTFGSAVYVAKNALNLDRSYVLTIFSL